MTCVAVQVFPGVSLWLGSGPVGREGTTRPYHRLRLGVWCKRPLTSVGYYPPGAFVLAYGRERAVEDATLAAMLTWVLDGRRYGPPAPVPYYEAADPVGPLLDRLLEVSDDPAVHGWVGKITGLA